METAARRATKHPFTRVLVAGAGGQLARALLASTPEGTHCTGYARQSLDITSAHSIEAALRSAKPDLVINCAAYNMVDRAESEGREEALNINGLGPAALAVACCEADVPLLHFSTDFVFDGEKSAPYTEIDTPNPLGVYGASKLAGEYAVLAASPKNWVVRVCRLFGPAAPGAHPPKSAGNFPLAMLALARTHSTVRVVGDQVGSPTFTLDLAPAIWELLAKSEGGLYQLSNSGEVSFADYAREIFRLADSPCAVEAISSAEYGAPARRPLYSTLSNAKANSAGVTPLRMWGDALQEFLLAR